MYSLYIYSISFTYHIYGIRNRIDTSISVLVWTIFNRLLFSISEEHSPKAVQLRLEYWLIYSRSLFHYICSENVDFPFKCLALHGTTDDVD